MPPEKKPVKKPSSTARKPAARKPAAPKPAAVSAPRELIEERAYYISRGDPGGDPVAHWLQAERELSAAPAKKPRKRAST